MLERTERGLRMDVAELMAGGGDHVSVSSNFPDSKYYNYISLWSCMIVSNPAWWWCSALASEKAELLVEAVAARQREGVLQVLSCVQLFTCF